LAIPRLPAVLVNPGVALPTKDVFAALGLSPGRQRTTKPTTKMPGDAEGFIAWLSPRGNDLEAAAAKLRPEIARVLAAIRRQSGCRLARMSGSGATCFGLFASPRAAGAAAQRLASAHPRWWVKATLLG
jgi:4-diphosphocytidyl-2-C-methyl-D-erythritol kinase